ncbi:PAS domain S-box-containing protein [Pseudomonas sp. JAI111]|uniref:PAS domain S-box protein n=1 Tax=Pseudomonas sp. JAI111 TaxID=2735913 RepID=UPI002168CD92|nr:PAS domain S-box protein [Pseudomonas sp. JAI111]MCS3835585.1 PAS domain S-box-containing protein [Pseudomonas sp. JAI111]
MSRKSSHRDDAAAAKSHVSSESGGPLPSVPDHLDLADVLDALPEAVYTTDINGLITFYNKAAAVFWGIKPQLGHSEFCGSWKLYWPDGTPLPHDQCPMAIALKEQRPIRGLEAIAERPDGTRIRFLAFPSPIFNANGTMIGAVNMLVDLTEQTKADEAALRHDAIVESSDDAIIAKDLMGRIINWNKGAQRLFGYTAEEAIGKPIAILIPQDRANEEPGILERIRRGERIEHYETIRRRKDGSLVEISLSISPIRNKQGFIVGAAKIARDITERRQAEEQKNLLIREMDHRVKNLFTLASSVVVLSARTATTSAGLASAISERLNALARAHTLTIPYGARKQQPTTLHTLINTILAPYATGLSESRAVVTGPDISIAGNAVTSFALLLHEFATNAAKYGALSIPEGRLDVSCSNIGDFFTIDWNERNGPPIECEPKASGFGTFLAKATVRGHLDGEIFRDWKPEGLSLRLTFPAKSLQET